MSFIIRGIAYPADEVKSNTNGTAHFRQNEIQRAAELLNGKPTFVEHDYSTAVGKTTTWFDPVTGHIMAEAAIDLSTEKGRQTAEQVRNGTLGYYSFGQEITQFKNNLFTVVDTLRPTEMSLVKVPALPNAKLLSYQEPNGPVISLEQVYSPPTNSSTNHNRMSETTTVNATGAAPPAPETTSGISPDLISTIASMIQAGKSTQDVAEYMRQQEEEKRRLERERLEVEELARKRQEMMENQTKSVAVLDKWMKRTDVPEFESLRRDTQLFKDMQQSADRGELPTWDLYNGTVCAIQASDKRIEALEANSVKAFNDFKAQLIAEQDAKRKQYEMDIKRQALEEATRDIASKFAGVRPTSLLPVTTRPAASTTTTTMTTTASAAVQPNRDQMFLEPRSNFEHLLAMRAHNGGKSRDDAPVIRIGASGVPMSESREVELYANVHPETIKSIAKRPMPPPPEYLSPLSHPAYVEYIEPTMGKHFPDLVNHIRCARPSMTTHYVSPGYRERVKRLQMSARSEVE